MSLFAEFWCGSEFLVVEVEEYNGPGDNAYKVLSGEYKNYVLSGEYKNYVGNASLYFPIVWEEEDGIITRILY